MASARTKIHKTTGEPNELEMSVAQALYDLENNVPELRAELVGIHFSTAKEVYISIFLIINLKR